MKKDVRLAIPIVLIILGAVFVIAQAKMYSQKKVCFGEVCVKVEVADTQSKRAQGLMYRSFLPNEEGMLFVFDSANRHTFWMKNTLIPLDIIWIDENKNVIDIVTAQPCTTNPCPTYSPRSDAFYVLEVNAGFAEAHNIKEGDSIRI